METKQTYSVQVWNLMCSLLTSCIQNVKQLFSRFFCAIVGLFVCVSSLSHFHTHTLHVHQLTEMPLHFKAHIQKGTKRQTVWNIYNLFTRLSVRPVNHQVHTRACMYLLSIVSPENPYKGWLKWKALLIRYRPSTSYCFASWLRPMTCNFISKLCEAESCGNSSAPVHEFW